MGRPVSSVSSSASSGTWRSIRSPRRRMMRARSWPAGRPTGEGFLGGGHGQGDFAFAAQRDFGQHLAGGGIDVFQHGRAFDGLAIDQVRDHHCVLLFGRDEKGSRQAQARARWRRSRSSGRAGPGGRCRPWCGWVGSRERTRGTPRSWRRTRRSCRSCAPSSATRHRPRSRKRPAGPARSAAPGASGPRCRARIRGCRTESPPDPRRTPGRARPRRASEAGRHRGR